MEPEMHREINKALTASVIFLATVLALGYLLGTDELYAEHPWLLLAGQWIGGAILVWWAITFVIPEGLRYISRQIALGKKDAKEED